ncbi:hypothetical protein L1889_06645 [Paenalcaligenes niemegkensis]|uniref:hypothetical protein n=1 Tax=Paenalcaligenes niemegkensis TaxID=2895469 RepID=UPI001EE95732|nr:hypothetical protein [Paenalcaligenes niemegkensis]MCQ9616424.1 hypothetical protein [Paenalcaligenes niemegkensis]
MSSKNKPLTDKELAALETDRDLAAELLEAVQQMKAGQVRVALSPVIEVCRETGLTRDC